MVLLPVEGKNHERLAGALGIARRKASRWRARFVESGRAGWETDAPGRGRKAVYGPEVQAHRGGNVAVAPVAGHAMASACFWARRWI